MPTDIFLSNGAPDFTGAFQPEFTDHTDSLKFLANILWREKYKLYIRDVSYLGFPSFHVYIPGISEVKSMTKDNYFIFTNGNFIENCLLKLKTIGKDNIAKCVNYLEKIT